jgi:vacuolar protein sorting-associated protein 35
MLGDNMDILKLLDLNTAFMKFAIKCKDNDVLASINHVLSSTLQCLRQFNRRLTGDGIKKLSRLLAVPLGSEFSLFDLTEFDGLILFLDYSNRKNLALKIVESLYRDNSKEKLDSVEKLQKLLKLVRPLIADVEDALEEDAITFECDQNEVSKMIFVVNSQSPEIIYEIYGELKNVFVEGGENRRKITLPTLANCIISFCHKISLAYDNKNGLVSEEAKKSSYVEASINSVDISQIDSDETFYKLMLNVYKLLNEIISIIAEDNPERALKLYLTSAAQVNNIQSDRNNFEEACASFMNAAMNIYQEGKYDTNLKYFLLSEISGYLLSFTILGNENVENIIKILMESGTKMVKRGEQFNSMLSIAQIYYSVIKDGNKVTECINKARKYADFAMTNPQNVILFIELLNKYLYFADNGDEIISVKPDQIDDLIELVTNHIQTIKNEVGVDSSFLPDIEKYFNNTIDIIKKRKTEENHKAIYDSVLNN